MTSAQAKLVRWKQNPAAMVKEEFGADPDPWQLEALSVFPSQDPDKLRISLQACVGPGKSCVLAWMGWNFLACYGEIGEHPKGAAIAVDWSNLQSNLWAELSKWQQRSEYLKAAFTWSAHRIKANDHPQTWFLDARSWTKTADVDRMAKTLSGLHSKYVLALIDESGTIPTAVLKTVDQMLSSCSFGKIVQAGNPSSLEGMLYAAATTHRHLWHVIRVTGDPSSPKAWTNSPRVPESARKWSIDQIKLFGRDDPWVRYSVLGEFPESSISALLGAEEVQRAMERDYEPSAYVFSQKRLGIDVSRFGDDPTILIARQGLRAGLTGCPCVVMRHQRDSPVSVNIANRIMLAKQRWGSELEFLDATGGWAAGARDILIAAGHAPMSIQYHAPAPDPRYYNMRAFMWWHGSQWVKNGGWLPHIPELVAELTTPTYTYKDGKLLIESKEHVKERLGRSPNHADALYQTFAIPDMPTNMPGMSEIMNRFKSTNQAQTDFDPFRDPATDPGGETVPAYDRSRGGSM